MRPERWQHGRKQPSRQPQEMPEQWQIPRYELDLHLSLNAKRILQDFWKLSGKKGRQIHLARAQIGDRPAVQMKVRTVSRAIAELRTAGYIVTRNRGPKPQVIELLTADDSRHRIKNREFQKRQLSPQPPLPGTVENNVENLESRANLATHFPKGLPLAGTDGGPIWQPKHICPQAEAAPAKEKTWVARLVDRIKGIYDRLAIEEDLYK